MFFFIKKKKIFVVHAASAVEGQVKEKSRLCQLLKELSEKFMVFL
jgi:kinesin family member C2/C3